jgi:hypothetical protein
VEPAQRTGLINPPQEWTYEQLCLERREESNQSIGRHEARFREDCLPQLFSAPGVSIRGALHTLADVIHCALRAMAAWRLEPSGHLSCRKPVIEEGERA